MSYERPLKHGFLSSLLIAVISGMAIGEPSAPDQTVSPTTHPAKRHKQHASAAMPSPAAAVPTIQTSAPPPAAAEPSTVVPMLYILIIPALIALFWLQAQGRKKRINRMTEDAKAWLERAQTTGGIAAPDTGTLIVPQGERALLSESSQLYEMRADGRPHIHLRTRRRIGHTPFYISQSHERTKKVLKETSSGTLALTDKTLLFIGSTKTVKVKTNHIVEVHPTIDTIVVSSSERNAPLVFHVNNPFKWFTAVKMVTSPDFTAAA